MAHAHLATIKGIDIYEDETHGDEVPFLFKINGKFVSSTLYDWMYPDEVVDAYNYVKGEMGND
tara:strand:+ start:422 stop:610 length:189 start_codon:yes stop_codon:yes gene_type:complete